MKRLRVLSIINTLYFGGDECRLLSLCKQIDRNRFDHAVLTLKSADPERETKWGSLRPQFESANINIVNLGDAPPMQGSPHGTVTKVVRSLPRLVRSLIKVTNYIRTNQIDVIDAHIGTGNQIGAAAAVLTHRPVVLTTYGLEIFHPLWLWKASEYAMFGAASAIITDSDAVAMQVRRKLRWPREIAVIPNGIEPPVSRRTRDEMRVQFNIPLDPNVRVIGQVGSLCPRKGHIILLESAAQLALRFPKVHFLLCGFSRNGIDYERMLRARSVEIGLADRVHFVGYPGPIGDVFQAIDIQVHAATAESLPQAIIEGMALGKPAVVTAVGGVPTMVSHEETGLVVPPSDVHALAYGLSRLLLDLNLAERLGNAAHDRYVTRYTDTQMARSIEEVLENVAARRVA